MQPESKVNLSRKESTRRGVELRDEGRHAADLARHDSAKPSPPSKNRDPREEDLNRSTSRVSNLFIKIFQKSSFFDDDDTLSLMCRETDDLESTIETIAKKLNVIGNQMTRDATTPGVTPQM